MAPLPSRSRSRLALAALVLVAAASVSGAVFAMRGGGETPRQNAAAGSAANPHPVAGTFKPDRTRLSDCGDEQPCLEQAFGNLSFYEGPKPAIQLFDEKMQSDKGVEADCHRIAHTIGSAALARYRGNVARAFAEGSSSCWSGYYHGILERAFTGVSSTDDLGRVARGLCADRELRKSDWLAYQCVHGLGHGLMIHTGYNLPFSLEICDRLATDWDRQSCSGGVFMENISSSYGVKSKWLRDNDLVYPCETVAERHKLYCYLMVTSRILQANGYDWRGAARICGTVERNWIATCFQSLGRDASGFTRMDPPRVLSLCRLGGRFESDCLWGAARDMTANYQDAHRSSELCSLAPAALRARCFAAIGTILGTLYAAPQDRRGACEVPPRYVEACFRGASGLVS